MKSVSHTYSLRVWGESACFTRPEFNGERFSYPLITPSAAIGLLKQIFWKPEFRYVLEAIHVLPPVKRDWDGRATERFDPRNRPHRSSSMIRNEINTRQSARTAQSWTEPGDGFIADDPKMRAQRQTHYLRNPAYVLEFHIELEAHADEPIGKYNTMLSDRVRHGGCFSQPYLGLRECTCYFAPDERDEANVKWNADLGMMLLEIEYRPEDDGLIEFKTHDGEGAQIVSGNAYPRFFNARINNGTLKVPAFVGQS